MSNPIILIVDDDPDIRTSLSELLTDEGYWAVSCRNGREALDFLQRAGRLPCMVLLDLLMPDMDGAAFMEAIHDDRRLSRIPVVVFSASDGIAKRVEALRVAGHLQKPASIDDLTATVRSHCGSAPPTG